MKRLWSVRLGGHCGPRTLVRKNVADQKGLQAEACDPQCGLKSAFPKVNERGFTLAGALTILAILAIFWALTLPLWARIKQRDNEEELIFRGNEYIEAIGRYHQKYGTYPPDLETLQKLKFIRKLYPDPMTKSGKWKVLHPDALVQTGAAGKINMPGGTTDDNKDQKKGKKNKLGLNSDDDDDDEDMEDNDSGNSEDLPGLNKDEDKDKDEEKEVESVGPVVGVVSRSKKDSIKIYNGQDKYNKWKFVYMLQQKGQPAPGFPPGGVGTPGGVNPQPGQKPPAGIPGMGGQKNPPTPFPRPPSPPDSGSDDDDDNN
jgi:type II secretory pathway pseudopilin PulG